MTDIYIFTKLIEANFCLQGIATTVSYC